MSKHQVGLYLIIEFEWPQPFSQDHAKRARQLHDVVQENAWIKEVVAASGGIGEGPQSIWIFWLANYAALDRLLHGADDPVSQAYLAFFSEMPVVRDKIREEVAFI